MRIHYYFLICLIYFLSGCSSPESHDFSSPEKAYETSHQAVSSNDMELYSRCFLKAEDKQMVKQLAAEGGFRKTVRFVKHDVVEKEIINESEVNLRVREVGERTSPAGEASYHFISTVLIKYHKTSDGWKVHSTSTISVQKATKIGDKYVPTE
jgi:hypothetical protein